jgi:hypothetical protein
LLLQKSDEAISLRYGKNVKFFDRPDNKNILLNRVPADIQTTRNQKKVTQRAVSQFEAGFSLAIIASKYNHEQAGEKSFIEFLLEELKKSLSLPQNSKLQNTKIRSYSKWLFDIVPDIDHKKLLELNVFFKTIKKEELNALGQAVTKLSNDLGKLKISGKYISLRAIDVHKELYDECCSCIEKYLKILYGVHLEINNNFTNYDKIKKIPFYKIIIELRGTDSKYITLLKPLSTIIWNADKHTGTIKIPKSRRIKFVANEGTKSMSYSSFIKLTKEICALTFILSRYFHIIILKALMNFQKQLNSNQLSLQKIEKNNSIS